MLLAIQISVLCLSLQHNRYVRALEVVGTLHPQKRGLSGARVCYILERKVGRFAREIKLEGDVALDSTTLHRDRGHVRLVVNGAGRLPAVRVS